MKALKALKFLFQYNFQKMHGTLRVKIVAKNYF